MWRFRLKLCVMFCVLVLCTSGSVVAQVAVVLNANDASVSLIDVQTYTERTRIAIEREPHHLYATSDNKWLTCH